MVDDFGRDEIARFGGLLDSLDLGLVSMDPGHDFAHVNQAAAALLGFPAGVTTTSAVTTHMMELGPPVAQSRRDHRNGQRSPARPVDRGEVDVVVPGVTDPPGRGVQTALASGFRGPDLGVFYDNSFLAQASALAQANFDALMDPQVLVQGIRSGSGPIVDLVYREVNRSTCEYLGLTRDDLLGHSLMEPCPTWWVRDCSSTMGGRGVRRRRDLRQRGGGQPRLRHLVHRAQRPHPPHDLVRAREPRPPRCCPTTTA